jgi:hypothetical protein
MSVTAPSHLLAAYLPTRRSLLPIALCAVAIGALWFGILAWSVCSGDSCTSAFWLWQAIASLILGLAYSCFFCALVASIECVLRLLHLRSAPRWPAPWPQPLTIAVLGWFTHTFAVLALQFIFRYHGATPPFGAWYFGLMPLLFK